MSTAMQAYYVDCPWCNVPTMVHFNEVVPRKNVECVAVCDNCSNAFCLLSSDYCKTCPEFYECAKFKSIDLISILKYERVIAVDPTYGRVIKRYGQ